MSVDNHDVADRYLASTVRIGTHRIRAGQLVTPEMLSQAKKAGITTLPVRSPMRCAAEHGICKKCFGLSEAGRTMDIGANVGVVAAEAIGEPSLNLSLKAFHTGGTAGSAGSNAVSMFDRLNHLLTLPKHLPNEAPLALNSGKVTDIEAAPQGGHFVHVNAVRHYVPATQEVRVKRHDKIERGDRLSSGVADPSKLLVLKGVHATQDYLANAVTDVLHNAAPVKQRNVEVVIRAMTNLGEVDTAKDHPDWVVGDMVPVSQIETWNRAHPHEKVTYTPQIRGMNVLPNEMQEDWLARLNFRYLSRTLTQAAREGWHSNVHGFSPVPASAYAAEFGRAEKKLKPGEYKGQY